MWNRKLTWRGTAYLLVACLRCALIGGAMLVDSEDFNRPILHHVFVLFSVEAWGIIMVLAALLFMLAVALQSPGTARVALVVGAAVSAALGGGFLYAYLDGDTTILPTVAFGTFVAKDLIICSTPLSAPPPLVVPESGGVPVAP